MTWGESGTGPGQFNTPVDVDVDGDGNVYVVDQGNYRIQKFTGSGTFLTQWGAYGYGDGEFTVPSGLVVTSGGEVDVADQGNNRVQRFTTTGSLLGEWGSLGSGNGQFTFPQGIAAGAGGEILVADTGNDRVQRFTATGSYLGQWSSQFSKPIGIDVDSEGDVYVVDQNNHRVQAFTSTGTYLTQWGSQGVGDGEFSYLEGVAVGPDDEVFVTDLFNHRVQRFLPPPAPSLSVAKAADQTAVLVGEPISYHVTVTNTGNRALTGVSVSDPNAPDCPGPLADLPVGGQPVVVDCTFTPRNSNVGTYTNVATVDSDQTGPVASDPVDVTVQRLRPDAKIRRGTGVMVGNDVYNTTGVSQTRTASVGAGGSATFTVKFQNDGNTDDDFVIQGPASTTRFTVTYWVAGVDVTRRVTRGTYRFESVSPGASRTMTVTVKATAAAPRSSVFTAKVKVTSDVDATRQDAVKAVVTRS